MQKTHRLKGLHIRLLFSYQKHLTKASSFVLSPTPFVQKLYFPLKRRCLYKNKPSELLPTVFCSIPSFEVDSRGLKQCGWRRSCPGKTIDNTVGRWVITKVISKDCSADTTALFPTLYKYIHRQYFLLFLFMIIEAECNLYKSLVVL